MLIHLSIRNIVLIEEADISLSRGLNVLTGETGAGKSILLDALGLVLGGRSDPKLIRTGAAQASVTAEFDVKGRVDIIEMLDTIGIEVEDILVLRRVLNVEGRTRCLANDMPVSVQMLKSLGDRLVETHGQHEQKGLLDPATHVNFLDAYGANGDVRQALEQHYIQWKKASADLASRNEELQRMAAEEEYLRHIAGELRILNPQAGEEETLTEKRSHMMQGVKFAGLLSSSLMELSGAKPVDVSLRSALRTLAKANLQTLNPVIEALERAASDVEEAIAQIEKIGEESRFSDSSLEAIEDRLFALKDAARKHRCTVDELTEIFQKVEKKLAAIDNGGKDITFLEKTEAQAKQAYIKVAETLSAARKKAAHTMEKAVSKELEPLKMASTQISVKMEPLVESLWGSRGMEVVRFEAATNRGAAVGPLHKIASGGELSRFMLAMKVVLAEKGDADTLIFDEIDIGTGGAVADAIGQRLSALGKTHQVLVVTHLAQVAAKGDAHLRVWKEEKKGKTFTKIAMLSAAERKEELARILAGAHVTTEARAAAATLMKTSL